MNLDSNYSNPREWVLAVFQTAIKENLRYIQLEFAPSELKDVLYMLDGYAYGMSFDGITCTVKVDIESKKINLEEILK